MVMMMMMTMMIMTMMMMKLYVILRTLSIAFTKQSVFLNN